MTYYWNCITKSIHVHVFDIFTKSKERKKSIDRNVVGELDIVSALYI